MDSDTLAQWDITTTLTSKPFGAILVLCVLTAIGFLGSINANRNIVEIEQKASGGLSLPWFIVIGVIAAFLTALMVYKPYTIDTQNDSRVIINALLYFLIVQLFWSIALFHSRINRGTATFASTVMLAALVWLGWACYNLVPESVYIFLLLLAWCFYLIMYTYNVDAHPWRPVTD